MGLMPKGLTGLEQPYFKYQLEHFLTQLDISISGQVLHPRGLSRLFSSGSRIAYRVIEKGLVRLEFTDKVTRSARTLESVRTYDPGDWERKIGLAYQKCLDLNKYARQAVSLQQHLARAERTQDWEELVEYLQGIVNENPEFGLAWSYLALVYEYLGVYGNAARAAAVSLAITPDDSTAQILWDALPAGVGVDWFVDWLEALVNENPNLAFVRSWLALEYAYHGRIKDAQKAATTAVELAPDNGWCHLNFSRLYQMAMSNATFDQATLWQAPEELRLLIETTGQAGRNYLRMLQRVDPSLHRRITRKKQPSGVEVEAYKHFMEKFEGLTLEALGCSYEEARQKAENHAREAMRLATDRKLADLARDQLLTVKAVERVYRDKRDKRRS